MVELQLTTDQADSRVVMQWLRGEAAASLNERYVVVVDL
jgi:hypothetical protein